MFTLSTKKMLLPLVICGLSQVAYANASAEIIPGYQLDEIVVSATRTEKNLIDAATSVSVITQKDLMEMNIRNIDEAFIRVPGIYVGRLSGIGSTVSQTVMRGVNAANSVAVLVDGVQVNDAYNGSVTWSSIPVGEVERIEVMRGPASVLYGGNAMAGVVNIITKKIDRPAGILRTSYGSENTQNHSFYYADKLNENVDFKINYEKKKSAGYVTDAVLSKNPVPGMEMTTTNKGDKRWIIGNKGKRQWDEDNIGIGVVYKMDETRNVSFNFSKNNYEYSYSNPVSYIGEDVVKKASTYFSTPGEKASNKYSLAYKDSDNGWQAVMSYVNQYKQHDTSIAKGTDSSKPNNRFVVDIQKSQQLSDRDNLVAGLNYRKDRMDTKVYNLSDRFDSDSKTVVASAARGNNSSWAAYVMDEHRFAEKVYATAGLRYDNWNTSGTIRLPGKTNAIDYDKTSYDSWNPSVSLAYHADDTSNIYFAWGKAFEAPSLYRMYSSSYSSGSYNVANPELRPQKSESYEVGYKKRFGTASTLGMSVYKTKYDGLLYKKDAGVIDGMNASRYENAGRAEVKGFELELNHQFNPRFAGFINYTYQNPVIKKALSAKQENRIVTSVPKEILRAGFNYNQGRWHGLLDGQYVSKRFSSADNSDTVNGVYQSYDPFFVMNLNIGYDINKDCRISFGVDNLLDREYFNYYYQPGRTYTAEMVYRF